MMIEKTKFNTEAEMCDSFIKLVPDKWTVYPETGGFDILLVRKDDGFQIGIEAKLRLSAKVIAQVAEEISVWRINNSGPDCRAVLVPDYGGHELKPICRLLGIETICISPPGCDNWNRSRFWPSLPEFGYGHQTMCGEEWFEFCPAQRIELPDYVPDTGAGNPSPIKLTDWKIRAIKIAVTIEKRGYVTRSDFKHHLISITRWTQYGLSAWLRGDGNGKYFSTDKTPDFRKQHPVNYAEIEDSYEDWKMPEVPDLLSVTNG